MPKLADLLLLNGAVTVGKYKVWPRFIIIAIITILVIIAALYDPLWDKLCDVIPESFATSNYWKGVI